MSKRKPKTLKDYLLKGKVLNRVFVDRNRGNPYKILDIKEERACGFDFLYLHIHYLDKQYKERESNIRSLNLGLKDLSSC